MSENVVIDETTHNGVETVVLYNTSGNAVPFYPDAVRYNEQTLTKAQQAQARTNIGVDNYITPQMFGAKADGSTDDTAAIQDMFDSITDGGVVYFPKGKYIVQHASTVTDGDYVAVLVEGKQGLTVIFDNGATVKQNLTTVHRYTMFRFLNCNGLEICGGVIEGDRNEHPDVTTGYGSKGIQIRNSENVYVHDMEIWNIFGDCMSISGTEKQCENVVVENCKFHDSYRNGFVFGGAKHCIMRNCRIYNVSGKPPQAGIDIESEYGYDNEDILVEGCYIHDCVENTIAFSSHSHELRVRDCFLDGNTQGQDTSDNIEIVNTTITGAINARNNTVLRNCTVQSVGAYDSADYPNVSVKAYDTVFTGNKTGTTFNFNSIDGKASLYLKDCEINHLEGSSHALFYSYNASNIDVVIEGGVVNLWKNDSLAVPFASGDYNAFKMVGCSVVAKSTAFGKTLLSVNAPDFQLVGCNVDLSGVTSYSPSSIVSLTSAVTTFNCHSNSFVTKAVTQFVLDLSAFRGNAYLTHNTAPSVNNFYLTGGTVFVRSNTTAESIEFTADDKYKLDNLERGEDGKSAYDIYLENGGTLSQTEWIASIASVAPTYAASIDEMTDPAKVYISSEGTLWAQVKQEMFVNENVFVPENAALQAYLESDGSLNTTGSAARYYATTDYLPFDGSTATSYTMVYRYDGNPQLSQNYSRLCYYGANKNLLRQTNLRSDYMSTATYFADNGDGTYTLELNKFMNGNAIPSSVISATRYIKMSFMATQGTGNAAMSYIDDVEIYFKTNEKPVYDYAWADTGLQYAHYAMTDNDYEIIANKVAEKLNS